jgi:hypothetical protein
MIAVMPRLATAMGAMLDAKTRDLVVEYELRLALPGRGALECHI